MVDCLGVVFLASLKKADVRIGLSIVWMRFQDGVPCRFGLRVLPMLLQCEGCQPLWIGSRRRLGATAKWRDCEYDGGNAACNSSIHALLPMHSRASTMHSATGGESSMATPSR